MSNDKLAKGLLVGFLSGAVVGGVLALLYAPKPGRELREDIRRKGGELAGDVEGFLRDAQQKSKELINEGKQVSTSLINDAKVKADTLLKDAETMLADAKKRVGDESARLRGAVRAGVDAYKDERGQVTEG
jgi:gas vesicle protein